MSVNIIPIGRLGNVMFQTAAAIGYAKKHARSSQASGGIKWGLPSNMREVPRLREFWPDITVDDNSYQRYEAHDPSTYDYKEIPHHPSGVTLVGFFQSLKYFENAQDEVKETFKLDINKVGSPSVSIHVRRGDYVQYSNSFPPITTEYIKLAFDYLKAAGIDFYYVNVFSDDIEWCKGLVSHVQGPRGMSNWVFFEGKSEYEDLSAMASCQPPETLVKTPNGDIKIKELKKGDLVLSYSTIRGWHGIVGENKHRCAPKGRRIQDIVSRHFDGELVVINTDSKETKYTPDHHCIAKIGDGFYNKHLVYLMMRGNKFRVGITSPKKYQHGRSSSVRIIGNSDVRLRFSQSNADYCWILKSFDSLEDALMEEEFVSAKFGIPQMVFVEKGRQEKLNLFWDRIGDNIQSGINALEFYGRSFTYPFINKSNRKKLTDNKQIVIRACNLMDGMKVLDYNLYKEKASCSGKCDDAWVHVNVSKERYVGLVYSMDVEINHTYIGDNIITHNCGHHIIANSSFSWWGAYLGHNPEKIVVCPHHLSWYGDQNGVVTEARKRGKEPCIDLIPQGWNEIKFR